MLKICILNRRTCSNSWLELPMDKCILREVIDNTNNFSIQKVKCKDEIMIYSNDNIIELNNQLIKYKKLNELDKTKVKALNIKGIDFIESMKIKDDYEFINGIMNTEEYGRYIATEVVKLPTRFLKYINFKQYGVEMLKTKVEVNFNKYGVLIR